MQFFSQQGPSGDSGPAGANGPAGPRVSKKLRLGSDYSTDTQVQTSLNALHM